MSNKAFPRARRIAQQIQQTLSELIRRELRDPRLGMITLTEVRVSKDLSYAKVFFSVRGASWRRRRQALVSKPARFHRDISGILLLDKALGVSSNAALQQVRALFGAAKAGHAGSLDPLASGLLPVCFGQATKVCGRLLSSGKTYRVLVQLGELTPSGDAETEVIERAPVPVLTG